MMHLKSFLCYQKGGKGAGRQGWEKGEEECEGGRKNEEVWRKGSKWMEETRK